MKALALPTLPLIGKRLANLMTAAVIAASCCTAQALPILTNAKVEPVQSTTATSHPGLLSDTALDLQTTSTSNAPLTVLEPGSFVLFGIGLVALGLWRLRRAR